MAATTHPISPVLDHVVVNVAEKLDEAARQYARLGFHLTERGHHTLGTSNNLAIFNTNYLELLGFLPERLKGSPNFWQHPPGLSGLVFKSVDPKLVHDTLASREVSVEEPMSFSRPVDVADATEEARFSVVRVTGDHVQNGRVFFCHHWTPELVWRPEWQSHRNGALNVVEFVIASQEPFRTASLYEQMFGPGLLGLTSGGVAFQAGAARILILDSSAVADRYAGAAMVSDDGSDRMVALAVKVASLDTPRRLFETEAVSHRPLPSGGIVVPHEHGAGVALAFVE